MRLAQAILCLAMVATDVALGLALSQGGKMMTDRFVPGSANRSDKGGSIVKHATTLIEQNKLDEAEDLLKQAITRIPGKPSLPLRNLLATLYQTRKDFVAEAATYHDILQIAPDNPEAAHARSLAILRMGAPDLATDYATKTSDVFSVEEIYGMQQKRAGRLIKWGEIEARYGIGLERFNAADRGILENAQVRTSIERAGEIDSPLGLNVEFDRIVALRNRVRMKEAIEHFLEIQQQNIDIPPYVLAAAADAYLYLRKPKLARDLYLQALELSAQNSQYPEPEWQFGLLYAYMDNNQFTEAQQWVAQLEKDIPPVLHPGIRRAEVDNEYYERMRVDAVRTRLYADQLNEGESMLKEVLDKAPFNVDARLTLGELKITRDQPRNAREQFIRVMIDDPANLYASVGIAQTSMQLGDYTTARRHVDMLTTAYPENFTVQRTQKDLRAHLRPRLTVLSRVGNAKGGSGGNAGNDNWMVDSILDSGTIYNHYSVFARTFNAKSNFIDNSASRHRVGVGAQYLSPTWRLRAELDGNHTGHSQIGASLNTTWFANDSWQFNAHFESNSNRIPLQAHGAGIKAKALAVDARFSHNESRNLGMYFSQLWFDDGNRRSGVGFDWFERWVSGPVYKLNTLFATSASQNSPGDVPYFNPRHDTSLDLQMVNEWMLWRRDRLSFSHRVTLGIGAYWQQGFGIKETPNVSYEHQWNFDTYRSLNYGIEYSRHPFDGVVNKRTAIFLNLTHHF